MASATPQYMSPEQVRGERPDALSDVYACGVVLYELATGRLPFFAPSNPAEMMRLLSQPPPPSSIHPSIDPMLERVIVKAMSRDPSSRHATARELRAELRSLVGNATRAIPRTPSPPAAVRSDVPAPMSQTPSARRPGLAGSSAWARNPTGAPPPRAAPAPIATRAEPRNPISELPPMRFEPEEVDLGSGGVPSSHVRDAPIPSRVGRSQPPAGYHFDIPLSSQARQRADALDTDRASRI
jgi:serine/threonine protein kinase